MTKTKTSNHSLQIVALMTIAVLTIGTMQVAAAGGDETKLEVRDGDFKAKFEAKDDGRMKFDASIEGLNNEDLCTISVNGVNGSFSGTFEAVGVDGNAEIDANHDTDSDEGENDFPGIVLLESGDTVTFDCGSPVTLELQNK